MAWQTPVGKLMVLSGLCNYDFKAAGQTVCVEGDTGNEIYIVLDGGLMVEVRTSGEDTIKLAELQPGDYFGEMVCMSPYRYMYQSMCEFRYVDS